MISATTVIRRVILLGAFAVIATLAAAQAPSPALLVVHQGENTLSIVDPKTGKVTGRVPTVNHGHSVTVSGDGKRKSGRIVKSEQRATSSMAYVPGSAGGAGFDPVGGGSTLPPFAKRLSESAMLRIGVWKSGRSMRGKWKRMRSRTSGGIVVYGMPETT